MVKKRSKTSECDDERIDVVMKTWRGQYGLARTFWLFWLLPLVILGWLCNASALALPDAPEIRIDKGEKVLVLPDQFVKAVAATPDFRLPTKADLTSGWAREKKKGYFPYIAWGDFNGDGLTDIAVILIGEIRWRFVIYHKTETDYFPFHIVIFAMPSDKSVDPRYSYIAVDVPQRTIIKTIPKEKEYVVKAQGKEFKYKFEHDSLETFTEEESLEILYWENGDYKGLGFGE